ncbi:YhcN/YlaJ family sporulation lipoprotein [Bacillus sp. 31A1R]|uniref:YhcN/YlaJ family sporulation lipoprotein n=1 Tax=Robertmurraya mangrovi TaxID=3098077 RepID=A0ABU5IU29_9BACI|nr:YhcN/YlaJ family sporulation lipoprotein [Bacillus sp. 31A1R]MDZ5470644.1 YhcN/YlaJ family sporulation lipoprotein [Bacillus sp. 31A1R]
MKKLFFAILSIALLAGCGTNNQAGENNQSEAQGRRTVGVKDSTIPVVDRQTGQEISRHLVELASSRPNVHDATAVVLGRYAVVGIDVDKDIERSQVGAIKYSVAESLKQDPHGANAIVIADPDLNARLREISEDIQSGKPVQGIMNELADIAGRLMPEIPADIVDPNPKESLEKPKNKLNTSESQKLEKNQQKQSKHHKENRNEQN